MNKLISLIPSVSQATYVIGIIETLCSFLAKNYVKDGNLYDAIIDTIIDYLRTLKINKQTINA